MLGDWGGHGDLRLAVIGPEDVAGEPAEPGAAGVLTIAGDPGLRRDTRPVPADLDITEVVFVHIERLLGAQPDAEDAPDTLGELGNGTCDLGQHA